MPYFYNDKINILFIHIPKTGGTSVETYLSKKYNIKLNVQSKLMDKIRFKLLIQDYDENPAEYENNRLDRFLGNTDFATYLSQFIC